MLRSVFSRRRSVSSAQASAHRRTARLNAIERLELRAMLAANQAPVNSVPGAQAARVDLPYAFTQYRGNLISISDADAGENAIRVTLSVDKGTITLLNPDPNGSLTYSAGDGTEDSSMTFVGTVADINSALQWVSYRPQASFTGLATFTITTNDLGNVGTGGAKTDTDTIAITVNPVPAFAPSPTYETLPGVLDTSLNGTGKQILSLTAGIDYIHDMKVMPDGKIVAVGALNDRFGIMRFNADMTLDASFGTNGMTQNDFGAGVHARSFAVDSANRLVVVGGNRIARYSANGEIDITFNTSGSVILDHVGQAYGIAIQPDGQINVVGRDNLEFHLSRLNTSGGVTANWAYEAGAYQWDYNGDYGRVVFTLDDGDTVIAGRGYAGGDQFGLIRINQSGTQEENFAYEMGDGEFVHSGLLLPDGRFLLVGLASNDVVISRHLQTGVLDTTFGNGGVARLPILNSSDDGYRATLAADGKILITGFANNGTNVDLFVLRMSYDGVPDAAFGNNGKVAVNFGGNNDYGYAIAALPNGKILAAGRSANDIALVRLLGDFNLNSPPENISLSTTSISDSSPIGTTVGTLTTVDPDEEPTYAYSLVSGTGSTDNGSFTIVGNELRTNVTLSHSTKPSLSVRIRTTDGSGAFFEKVFSITVSPGNTPPSAVTLSRSTLAVPESLKPTVALPIADVTVTDDGVGTNTLSLSGDDASFFSVADGKLWLRPGVDFDYGVKNRYSVVVSARDASLTGSTRVSTTFTLIIDNDPTYHGREYVEPTSGQTVTDADTRSGVIELIKRGGGKVVLTGSNAHSGGTTVEAGEVVVRNTAALGSGRLTVKAGATVQFDVHSGNVTMGALTVEPGGRLDIGYGRFTLPQGGYSLPAIRQLLLGGFVNDWVGASRLGTRSAASVQGGSVGYVVNDDGSITVGFAAHGDTNVDGTIDLLDLSNFIAAGKFDQGTASGWADGDFNYDGIVDILDATGLISTGLVDAGAYIPVASPSATAAGTFSTLSPTEAAFLSLVAENASTASTSVKKTRFVKL
jgi:uncharacterized delta-60 repeat protein